MSNLFLSTSISLRRNFADLPFPNKMSPLQKEASFARVSQAVDEYGDVNASREAAGRSMPSLLRAFQENPGNGSVLQVKGDPENISVFINHQDGVILSITSGGEIDAQTIEALYQVESIVFRANPAAQDEQIGYLTSRPLLAGTGAQIHYVLHLPIMTTLKQIERTATEIEQNHACLVAPIRQADEKNHACLYIVSNKRTSQSIGEMQNQVREAAEMLAAKEKLLAEKMFNNPESILIDQVFRAYGILKNARRMNEREFLTLWSSLRMGAENQVISVPLPLIDRLLQDAIPEAAESGQKKISNYQRAERIRRRMEEK